MSTDLITWLRKPGFLKRIWKKFLKLFYYQQWILLTSIHTEAGLPAWKDFRPIIPPPDRIWADPFIWKREDTYYIFYEDMPLSTQLGRISCITLDDNMQPLSNSSALERPYHLSYPFIFEYQSQIYMLPESKHNNSIELYRCTHFPDQWEFTLTLFSNLVATDSTLLQTNGKWWLFTHIFSQAGSGDGALHLFYADQPLTNQWQPHPKNPVVADIHLARPAGRIFTRDNTLIRPSQDCSLWYGYALNFNQIITLTENDYKERCQYTFKPPYIGKYLSTHTWSQVDHLRAIDAEMWRSRLNLLR